LWQFDLCGGFLSTGGLDWIALHLGVLVGAVKKVPNSTARL